MCTLMFQIFNAVIMQELWCQAVFFQNKNLKLISSEHFRTQAPEFLKLCSVHRNGKSVTRVSCKGWKIVQNQRGVADPSYLNLSSACRTSSGQNERVTADTITRTTITPAAERFPHQRRESEYTVANRMTATWQSTRPKRQTRNLRRAIWSTGCAFGRTDPINHLNIWWHPLLIGLHFS